MDATADDASRLAAIRELLPATGAGIYLATATAGPLPAETDRALAESDAWELRVGRAGPDRAADHQQRYEEAGAVVAAVLGVDPQAIVLGPGVGSLAAAYAATLAHRAAERVVLLGAIAAPLRGAITAVARSRTAEVVEIPYPIDAAAIEAAIGPSDALVVSSLVDPDTGALRVIDALVARAQTVGAAVLLEASLAAGAIPLSPATLGVDAVVVDAGHWLLGPEGTAAMWVGPTTDAASMARLTNAVDALPRRSLLGLARSVGWLLMVVGLPWAHARTRHMAGLLLDGLAGVDGIELRTPPARSAACAVFAVRGWTAEQAQDELGSRVFAILDRTTDGDALLASVGAWTSEAELERFLGAVAELAAHTPESLPRRPTLVILGSGSVDTPT